MDKVLMVNVVMAECNDMLTGKKSMIFAATYDASISSEEIYRDVLEQTRECGLYFSHYGQSDPMTEQQAEDLLMAMGITPNRSIVTGGCYEWH